MSANAQMTAKGDAMYYVHSFLCLLIMFGFGQLPPVEPLTALGMRLIGIFLGLLYGWIFIDIVWPSMAGLLALMLVGGMKPVALLNRSFGDPIVVMMFFIFVFCATINHYGLSRFISLWFITRKFVAGRPWVFTFTFLASMFILGGLTSASPAAIIGWSILYGICDVCGYKKGDGYPTMMVFGIVFASQVGMSLIPFKQAALTVFKPDMEKLKKLDASKLDTDGALKLSKVQKLILCFLFALVALLLLPNFLPADLFISKFLKSIGNTGICVFLVTVMCFLKVDGKPLLKFKAMIDSGVAWGIILLLAVVQPLSGAMAAQESGITNFLMMIVEPIFGGSSPVVFALFIGFVATALTQVMNNGAVGVALMPVIFSYCSSMNVAPELPLIMVVMGVHLAFLTPAASASAALLHGNEWSDSGSIWKTAPLVILLSWIAIAVVTVVLGGVLF